MQVGAASGVGGEVTVDLTHPEAFCDLCGQRNVWSWSVAREEWAIAGLGPEIVCPSCFAELHFDATGEWVTWQLVKDL